jgi:L-rhamnose mutarotase
LGIEAGTGTIIDYRSMYTLGLALRLRPGVYDEYKRAHDELWPELAAGMRSNEVSMAIFRDGDRLFLFAAAPSEAHWQRSRQDPVLSRWDALMARLLETDDRGKIAFTHLPRAFGFGEFRD